MKPEPFLLLVDVRPKPERWQDALEHLRAMTERTRAEDGCERLEYAQTEAEPHRLIVIERWTSRELWRRHMDSPHNAEGNRVLAEMLSEPVRLSFLNEL